MMTAQEDAGVQAVAAKVAVEVNGSYTVDLKLPKAINVPAEISSLSQSLTAHGLTREQEENGPTAVRTLSPAAAVIISGTAACSLP